MTARASFLRSTSWSIPVARSQAMSRYATLVLLAALKERGKAQALEWLKRRG